MACYDSASDTIHNCTPGTLVYMHEEGHRKFNKQGYHSECEVVLNGCLLFCLVFLTYHNKTFAIISIVIMLIVIFLEEMYAWIFAFNKYFRKKQQ